MDIALAMVLAVPMLSLSLRPWNVPLAVPAAAIVVSSQTSLAPGASAVAHPDRIGWFISLSLCGAGVVLLRTSIGHARVQLLLRRSKAVRDSEWLRLLANASCQIGLRRHVHLRCSNDTDVPLSYGLLRPVILLPGTSDQWSADRRRVVLLHELVHVRRIDWLSCLLSQLAGGVYWFHPLAWMAVSRFRHVRRCGRDRRNNSS
jgi:beta-lactamase regulating signal transducer with metallopeptidase domain